MLKKIVIYGIYTLVTLNFLLIIMVVAMNFINKFRSGDKEEIKKRLVSKVDLYLKGDNQFLIPLSSLELELLKEIIINYLSYIKGDTKKKLIKLAKKSGVIEEEIKTLNSEGQWWEMAQSAYVLGVLEVKEAIPFLLEGLDSDAVDLRYQSGKALIKIARARYLKVIIDRLVLEDKHPYKFIVELLAQIEDDIYAKMERFIRSGKKEYIIIALNTLASRKDYRALTYIRSYLNSQKKELLIVALEAVYRFGDIGAEEYFKLIVEQSKNSDEEVRAMVAKVLAKFMTEESREILARLMEDRYWQVRFNAATSLLTQNEQGLLFLSKVLASADQFARDMAWQFLQQEIIFNDLRDKAERKRVYQQILDNIIRYQILKQQRGLVDELEKL